ncbi:MAG TPA: hypothetical protein VNN79_01665, partial [Actinomycetota bacterium]|nr:hypothetical protein [Actinomycetota bacterium]
ETDKAGKVSSTEDEERVADATSWLLAAYDTPEDVTHVIELNVGTGTKPVWLPWTIKSVDGSLIRRIRSRAADSIGDSRSRMSAASNVEAAFRSNLEVIVEGTVDPDLREAAQARNIADATVIVEGALRNKQGLVDQVAGAIYALSGYDEEDVRDQVEQAAARSS